MYYTHGDMVVYRSAPKDRLPPSPQRQGRDGLREREILRERVADTRPAESSVAQQLMARISQLEERLSRLEASLEGGGQELSRRAGRPGGEVRQNQPAEVRVSLHPQGGMQATLGQVRMLQHD